MENNYGLYFTFLEEKRKQKLKEATKELKELANSIQYQIDTLDRMGEDVEKLEEGIKQIQSFWIGDDKYKKGYEW